MAKIMKCDRCKKIYSLEDLMKEADEEWVELGVYIEDYTNHYFDLCKDCRHSLYNWFMEGEKRN